jgi:hypothetical protein
VGEKTDGREDGRTRYALPETAFLRGNSFLFLESSARICSRISHPQEERFAAIR